MKVLILKDTYNGAYNSFDVFYKSIFSMLLNEGVNVYIATNIEEAVDIINKVKIDFSINIGIYHFYINDKPLYEIHKIVNYQWIIDNPLRYDKCDFYSPYNRMIFIDENFKNFCPINRNDFLYLPIPFGGQIIECSDKIDAILAPIKIKSEKVFEEMQGYAENKELIMKFINNYDFDFNFGDYYYKFRNEHFINDEKNFFEIVNGIIRIRKRKKFISSIKKHRVVIVSDNPDNVIFPNNVTFINPCSYEEVLKMIKSYKYVINCNPNFDYCIHDRISYSVTRGTIVISDENELLKNINFPLLVKYSNLNVDDLIDKIEDYNEMLNKQFSSISSYVDSNIVSKIVENFSFYKLKEPNKLCMII